MAKLQKTITYDMPDVYEGNTNTQGKTSTQDYDGPEELILWIDKESGEIEQTWDPDDYTERPVPLNCKVETLKADSDENIIKIGMLFGGFAEPKIYEVRVGPASDKNSEVVDPSDPRRIYDENAVVENWEAPIKFKTDWRHRSDDFIRAERNGKLKQSDARIAEDMPADTKQKWLDYRQKLRDVPADWADVPNHFIKWPEDPDGEYHREPENDPELTSTFIKIADRTAADADAIGQLTPYPGIDE